MFFFILHPRLLIDEAYLVYGHTLKHGPDCSLIFFFPGYTNEIPLPNLGFYSYSYRELTIPLVPQEEARRSSVSGSRSMNAAMERAP